jgi:hypothetical protein
LHIWKRLFELEIGTAPQIDNCHKTFDSDGELKQCANRSFGWVTATNFLMIGRNLNIKAGVAT